MHSQKEVKMQLITRYGTIAVVIHAIVVALHGSPRKDTRFSVFTPKSVCRFYIVAPIAAMILL